MTKRGWRQLMQALYESHFDPRKDEELNQSKIEIENKLPKILKLVKERRPNRKNRNAEANSRKESELIELIEDFHKQYQFVYDLYDHIKGQLSPTVNGSKDDDGYFTATSDSESETEKDVNPEGTHLNNGSHKQHHEKLELADPKKNFTNLTHEKASLNSEYVEVMNKAQENAELVQKLEEESRALQEKLRKREQELSSVARMHYLRQKEASALIKELESKLSSVNTELDSMCSESRVVEARVENRELQAQVSNLEKVAKEMDEELSALVNGVDGTEEDSVSEVSKIKGLMVQVNHLKLNVDCMNAKKGVLGGSALHENLLDQVNKMKRDLGFLRKKNTELESKLKKKARENSELLSQIDSLKKEQAIKTQKMQKEMDDSVVRAKDLESEVHNLSNQISDREKEMARKDRENVQLKQEMEGLQEKTVHLEKMLKEREDQLCALQNKLEPGEDNNKSAQIVALMTQANHLEEELESKNELERQIKIKNQDISTLTSEKELLNGRILELEKKLENRGDEFSKLQNDMSAQIVALTGEINHLQQETDMKRKLEDQISSLEREINQLGEEKESLQSKFLELEITLTDKEDEIVSLQRKLQVGENEISARVSGLTSQITYLQGALSAERKNSLERSNQMENQNNELTGKISEQQVLLKRQEESINKLHEDCKLVKGRFLQAADRKMDELAAEFRNTFEATLRLLNQRIRVAEQLHAENKDHLKKMQERCEQEHPGLERKHANFMLSSKADLVKISDAMDNMIKGMEFTINDFETKEGNFLQRLSRVSDELQVAKNWVRWTTDELKPWKNEPTDSPFAPMDEKEQEKIMKEKVKRLEAKASKEKSDNSRLKRGMYELQKKVLELEKVVAEKDEGLLRLGTEKVEAIRQLCMWIDYHQSRFNHLKGTMSMNKTRSRVKP